jgi:hypothetical protein
MGLLLKVHGRQLEPGRSIMQKQQPIIHFI